MSYAWLFMVAAVCVTAATPTFQERPRSVMQACHRRAVGGCGSAPSIVDCLHRNVSAIQDPTCQAWVVSYGKCVRAVEAIGGCSREVRYCVLLIAKDQLARRVTAEAMTLHPTAEKDTRRRSLSRSGLFVNASASLGDIGAACRDGRYFRSVVARYVAQNYVRRKPVLSGALAAPRGAEGGIMYDSGAAERSAKKPQGRNAREAS
jgi:hypothetical protein